MNIVFVHFGDKIPRYLVENLRSATLRFEDHNVFLLRDSEKNPLFIENLNTQIIQSDHGIEQVRKSLEHPHNFRDGFWIHSLNRFIALANFAINSNAALVHFESDILIASDFPFEEFSRIETSLAFPLVSEARGIASTLYVRDQNAGLLLKKIVASEISNDPKSTDMTVLRRFYDNHKDEVTILPTTGDFEQTVTPSTPREITDKWVANLRRFKGVFDGADFGYFLLGTDPRNLRGFSSLRTTLPDHYVKVKSANFSFNRERDFVDQIIKNEVVPIFTLHATCKGWKLFKIPSTRLLRKRVEAQYDKNESVFIYWAFKYNVERAILRRLGRAN